MCSLPTSDERHRHAPNWPRPKGLRRQKRHALLRLADLEQPNRARRA